MVIDRFAGTYGFLSNFSAAEVSLDGESYPSVEHAFQAAKALLDQTTTLTHPLLAGKTVEKRWREIIQEAETPAKAKRLGRRVTPIRPDWEEIKVQVMRDLLWQKFSPGRKHLQWLLDTRDAILIEGNTWGDVTWGVCNGQGANRLGVLLMEIRHTRRTGQQ